MPPANTDSPATATDASQPPSSTAPRAIEVIGARVNTLKNLSCRFPHEQMTVITGPSGSGKSSLAFDTLYAEGQRRYLESLSTYARQFLERIERPDVDQVRHILPAIALEQKNSVKNARSTVGTATEVDDYLRLLWATLGQMRCIACGGPVGRSNPQAVVAHLRTLDEGAKVLLLAPVSLAQLSLENLRRQGYFRVYHEGAVVNLDELPAETLSQQDRWLVVIDRLILRAKTPDARLAESVQQALRLGAGTMSVLDLSDDARRDFRADYACQDCGTAYTEPTPQHFSFNSPLGACPACEGFGRIIGLDLDKIIPNKSLTLRDGAVHPFTTPANQDLWELMLARARPQKVRLDVPYHELSEREQAWVLDGDGEYPGVRGFFDWMERKKYKVHVRVMLAKYRDYAPCPACDGARLRPESLSVFVGGRTFGDIQNLPLSVLSAFFEGLDLSDLERARADRLLRELSQRVGYLNTVGLGYLTLARQSRTLSGGESQRINLSTALGSALTDTLYVLDEPTVGLHPRDTQRLLDILRALRDHGNTVVVVEHDPDVILAADRVLDLGPAGGAEGGRILYEGPVDGLMACTHSPTAQALTQRRERPTGTPPKPTGWIEIVGARGNNLQNLTVRIPTGLLVCVTGVSGSGKSTLIKHTLYAGYQRHKGAQLTLEMAPHDALVGLDGFADVVLVDQSPPGRSTRSNPVTYVKAYDEIRERFGQTPQAKLMGLTASDFSFNTPGGRCETCEGLGTVTVDMQFMADVTVLCPDCRGRRFSPTVLSVTLGNKSIDDVLRMTVDQAVTFFRTATKVRERLEPLRQMGLGYLQLGQSTDTLSGGEAQRLKLAAYLRPEGRKGIQPHLFLFDEPTTGLHLTDIDRLVAVLRQLIAVGHAVVVIEHNLDFVAQADYLIDLGPEGGSGGGRLVSEGSVPTVSECEASYTGQFLAALLNSRG